MHLHHQLHLIECLAKFDVMMVFLLRSIKKHISHRIYFEFNSVKYCRSILHTYVVYIGIGMMRGGIWHKSYVSSNQRKCSVQVEKKSQKRLQIAQRPKRKAKLVILLHRALKKTDNRSKKIPEADAAKKTEKM